VDDVKIAAREPRASWEGFMRRFAFLVMASVLVGGGVLGALEGCGSDDDDTARASPDGSTGDESSSGSSGTSGGSSGSFGTSGGAGQDASSSSGRGGNLPASNPGKLTCGTVECDAGEGPNASVCCVRQAGPACAREDDCNAGELRVHCDEPADCTFGGGTQCCFRRGGRDPRTECARDCGRNGVRICKKDEDCGDSGACSKKKCGDFELRVCGRPEGCQ
jgi:hypothetical protein